MEERRYEILHALGGGGFGTVYRARLVGEGGFSKAVALKVLHPNLEGADEIARRLRDEARVLGLIRHRAIVGVDGLIRMDGRWAVVMEFVEGADLKRVLRHGPLPCGPALEVAAEVASALHAAYTARGPDNAPLRLLHRDIKPANIQLTPAGEVKVLDFGIARAEFTAREAETRSLFFGTLEYMAPERIDQVDGPAGDVYALGAVLYESILGQPLGRTSSNEARHRTRMDNALGLLAETDAGRCEPLMRLLADTLAFEPAERPQARELQRRALELVRILNDITLSDFAEQRFNLIQSSDTPQGSPGEFTGSLLSEGVEVSADPTDPAEIQTTFTPVTSPQPHTPRPEAPGKGLVPAATAGTPVPRPSVPPPLGSATPEPARAPAHAPEATYAPAPTPAPPRGRRTIAALLLLGVLVGGGLLLRREPAPAQPATRASAASPTPTAEVAIPAPAAAPPEPEAPTAPATASPSSAPKTPVAVAKTPAPTPKAAPKAAPKADRTAPSTTASVTLSGDAQRVSLKSANVGVTLTAGGVMSLPAGTYAVTADFGEGPLSLSPLTLTAGDTLTLKCQSSFQNCTERR